MSTEPMIRFSGTPVEKPDLTPKWERPSNWPRIDLIPIRGISYHVMYLIVRKPAPGHGLCFAATVAGNASTWYIERISVSEDGKVVTPVEGSRQTSSGTGSTKIDYQFPAEDPVGTIYAMKVAVTDPTKLFSVAPYFSSPTSYHYAYYLGGTVLEAVVRQHGIPASSFQSIYGFSGPWHCIYYKLGGMFQGGGFSNNHSLHMVEFREGSKLQFTNDGSPGFKNSRVLQRRVADWDDDFVVEFKPGVALGTYVPPRIDGTLYPLSSVKTLASDEPFDWGASTQSLIYMFTFHTVLTVADLPGGFGSAATSVQSCFDNCASLQTLTLPDGFGSAATSVQSCFYNCASLQTLTLPDGFGAVATNALQCFYGCSSLQTLTLPDGFGAVATNVSNCFYNCASLQTLTLPDGFGAVATNVSNCFYGCASLQTLTLPDGFGAVATNVSNCFYGCSSLQNVTGAIKFPISFDIHWSTKLTHESLVNIISGLVAVTSTKTLTIGATNKAKLSEEEIAVATAKGWTIV